MKIDENQINQIYAASQSKSAKFKNLNYSERLVVEKALKAFQKNPAQPKSFTTLGKVNISHLLDTIEGKNAKTLASTEKTFARILGAKSSEKLVTLAKSSHPNAFLALGRYYEKKGDLETADRFFLKAFDGYNKIAFRSHSRANREQAKALFELGKMHLSGVGRVVKKDKEKANFCFRLSAFRFMATSE